MHNPRSGFGLIMIILTLLIISAGSIMLSRSMNLGGPVKGPDPIQRTWTAVCAANKALITQQLQIYAIQNEPMKQLDLQRLFSPSGFKTPDNCPCSYTFDAAGQVVCKAHP